MAIVEVVSYRRLFHAGGLMAQVGRLGPKVGSHSGAALHPSREPGELSQWLSHDDSTINIILGIVIIIIIGQTPGTVWHLILAESPNQSRDSVVIAPAL